MKPYRIYGVKNKKLFCHFPRGNNRMEEIKIQCYFKKKIKSFHGKQLICINPKKWQFTIGDILCTIEEHKPMKFKVSDEENKIFKDNQIAGMFYLNTLVSDPMKNDTLFMEYVDDEIIRLQDCKIPPYREVDSSMMSLAKESTFKSPVTKQSARNRELVHLLCKEEMALKRYEIYARNQILLMNCNSWFNRFGKDYVLKNYILSAPFFEKLFEFINQYFFANILSHLGDWSFALDTPPKQTSVQVTIHKDKLEKPDDIKYIISAFQNDIIHVVAEILCTKKKKKMMKHVFGRSLSHAVILTYAVKEILPKEYQKLYNSPGIYFME